MKHVSMANRIYHLYRLIMKIVDGIRSKRLVTSGFYLGLTPYIVSRNKQKHIYR